MSVKMNNNAKNICDIIDCNLEKDIEILMFFVQIFRTQLGIKPPFKFSFH